MESAADSLALASRDANVDAPRRHLGVFGDFLKRGAFRG